MSENLTDFYIAERNNVLLIEHHLTDEEVATKLAMMPWDDKKKYFEQTINQDFEEAATAASRGFRGRRIKKAGHHQFNIAPPNVRINLPSHLRVDIRKDSEDARLLGHIICAKQREYRASSACLVFEQDPITYGSITRTEMCCRLVITF